MRIYDASIKRGKRIQGFGSAGATVATLISHKNWYVATLELEPNGVLGDHRTSQDQLVIIVQGAARVSSEKEKPVDVAPGTAVFWTRGEAHEMRAGSKGLTAIVIEGDRLEQSLMMSRKRVTG